MLARCFLPLLLFGAISLPAEEPRTLRAPFWVADGAPVLKDDLAIRINSAPVKVSRLLGPKDDLLLLVVLDWAGDLSFINPARQALLEQISTLAPGVQVALLHAQDSLKVLVDPGAQREQLAEAIQALPISGRAGLLDSLDRVQTLSDSVAYKARVRTAILFLSDSDIANYMTDYTNPVVNASDSGDLSRRFPETLVQEKIRQLGSALDRGETPFFLVHLNFRTDRVNNAYQRGLLDLASASGGAAEFCRSVAEIPAAIQKTMAEILSLQLAEVELQGPQAKQLDLSIDPGGKRANFRQRRLWKGR